MFTFHWVELLVVVIGGLLLFMGLVLLLLRRRNEVLQEFLLPEEPDLEDEFFRVRTSKQTTTVPEESHTAQEGSADTAAEIQEETGDQP